VTTPDTADDATAPEEEPLGVASSSNPAQLRGTTVEIAADELPEVAKKIQGRSPWQLAWARLKRDRVAMVSLVVIIVIIMVALGAPLIAKLVGHGPYEQYRETGLTPAGLPKGPSSLFWLGTDSLGRELQVTEVAVVDEIACAAELVMGKSNGVPVAVVRGIEPSWFRDGSVRDEIVRHPNDDLFR